MSKQIEYVASTPLLDEKGNLLAKGWARHNVFKYERRLVKPRFRLKEWDFHQIQDGQYKVLINFFNILHLKFCIRICIQEQGALLDLLRLFSL